MLLWIAYIGQAAVTAVKRGGVGIAFSMRRSRFIVKTQAMKEGYDRLMAQNWIESYKENYRRYSGGSNSVSDAFSESNFWYRDLGPFGELNWDWHHMRPVWTARAYTFMDSKKPMMR